MKISFPYMGCVTGYKKLLQLLGHDVIMPNKPSQRTIDLGVKYSPEFICFPFKVMLGTYIEAAEKGAEVIISSGGHGPCRAGLYGEVHEKILESLGYNIKIIIFDSIYKDFKNFYKTLMAILNKTSPFQLLPKLYFVYKLILHMDTLEKQTKIIRAYEQKTGAVNACWQKIIGLFEDCKTLKDLKHVNSIATSMLQKVPLREVKEQNKLRVGIVGEIYVAMESSVNMDIEQKLNDLGVEVENVHYISSWLEHNLNVLGTSRSHQVIKKATRFVEINCGGHDMENIGWMVDFKERNFDAVIHLMPFACLPELVTQSIIPTISEELNLPILTLSLDEQSGMANNQTRIEAFIDLLRIKKQKSFANKENIPLQGQELQQQIVS